MNSAPSTCKICGCESFDVFRDFGAYQLLRCSDCDTVVCSRVPGRRELDEIYSSSYYQSEDSVTRGYDDYLADRDAILRSAKSKLDLLARHGVSGGRLLDVGCAAGFFLQAAREAGFEVEGVELSQWAAEHARKTLGLRVSTGTLSEVRGELKDDYDAVTLWDVIEHLPDPVGDLSVLHSLMSPGAVLAVMTPNIHGLAARLMGKRWVLWKKPDEHIYYFSKETLGQALDRAGFDLIKSYPIGYGGKHVSLDFIWGRLRHYAPALVGAAAQLTDALGMGGLRVYADLGDNIVVIARRR